MAIDTKKRASETLIAIVSDGEVAECIQQYCETHAIKEKKIKLLEKPLAEASAIVNGGANIVIVQAGSDDDESLEKLEKLCGYVARGGSFIVILDDPSTQSVRRLFRQGVTDVLPTPVATEELIAALNTARSNAIAERAAAASDGEGKIISIMKTAGGVGATTVAVNMARELSEVVSGGVALVDLDIQFGGVSMALDLKPRMNINDAIRAGDRLDGTLLKSVMTQHQSGFDVLPASAGITPLNVIDEEFITHLFGHLKQTYDVILVDLPMVWTNWTHVIIDASDLIAPVVETTVRSADGARRIVQGLRDLGASDAPLFGIANKVDKAPNTRERLKNLGSILGAAPEAIIRADEKLAMECGDVGSCFKDASATAAITQDFTTASQKLLGRFGASVHVSASSAADKKGLRLGRFAILGGKS